MEVKTSSRNHTLDLIRVLAVCLVVLTHSCVPVLHQGGNVNLTTNVLESLSRPGVPLFLMISGALMLNENKQKSTRDILLSAKNMLILTLVWSFIYAIITGVVAPLASGQSVSAMYVAIRFAFGNYHMWYLYMLIGLYVSAPFLRCFVKKENKNLVLLYIAISLFATFLMPIITLISARYSTFQYAQSIIEQYNLQFFTGYITYFLTGWYIIHIGIQKRCHKILLYVASILSYIAVIGCAQITKDTETTYSNLNILIYFFSVGAFVALNEITLSKEKEHKVLRLLSDFSFGIYITHAAIDFGIGNILPKVPSTLLYISLRFTVVLVLSFLLCCVMSKIPLVKKLLRF